MNFSKHAIARSQQRGIPKNVIDLIMEFGTPQLKTGGAIEFIVLKKDKKRIITHLKRLINLIDKTKNKAVLINNKHVITVYRKN